MKICFQTNLKRQHPVCTVGPSTAVRGCWKLDCSCFPRASETLDFFFPLTIGPLRHMGEWGMCQGPSIPVCASEICHHPFTTFWRHFFQHRAPRHQPLSDAMIHSEGPTQAVQGSGLWVRVSPCHWECLTASPCTEVVVCYALREVSRHCSGAGRTLSKMGFSLTPSHLVTA